MVVTLDKALDLAELRGQIVAKRAMEIAAAGGHHLALVGPGGCGKSSLAVAFATLLPSPTADQLEELSQVYREAGRPWSTESIGACPVVAPSIEITPETLIGGRGYRQIGDLALAHHGLVIVDDADRFPPRSLSAIREALDRGEIRPNRGRVRSARFQLLVTAQTIPCDLRTACHDPLGCELRPLQSTLRRFIDVVDIQVTLDTTDASDWACTSSQEPSFKVFRRIASARLRQSDRGLLNRDLNGRALTNACRMDRAAEHLLDQAACAQDMSGRDVAAVMRVARTLADLEGLENLERVHIAESLIYRFLPSRL